MQAIAHRVPWGPSIICGGGVAASFGGTLAYPSPNCMVPSPMFRLLEQKGGTMKWIVLAALILSSFGNFAFADSVSDDPQQQNTDSYPSDPSQAQPQNWNDRDYQPNEADDSLAAKVDADGDKKKERDMKAALCSFYQNCR